MNVNPFVPGHYAEDRTRKSMICAPFRELHGPHKKPIALPLHTASPSATNLSARRLVIKLEPFGLPMRRDGARFCCSGATVTGGRTGVLWKSLDKFWALPLGLRVYPQGTTGERESFGGCALRLPVEPRLHRKYTQDAEKV